MSQSYLIFSEGGRKMEINTAPRGNITVSYDGMLETLGNKRGDEIIKIVNRWEKGEIAELKFSTVTPETLFDEIKTAYEQVIVAAGGLVRNPKGELLMIFRNGRWDLPKGKIEEGEKIDDGAVREVMEETGLKNVKVEKEFIRTYHTYLLKNKYVLKETIWFIMKTGNEKTTPQLSEGITSVDWIAADNIQRVSGNTFDNILLLLKTYFKGES